MSRLPDLARVVLSFPVLYLDSSEDTSGNKLPDEGIPSLYIVYVVSIHCFLSVKLGITDVTKKEYHTGIRWATLGFAKWRNVTEVVPIRYSSPHRFQKAKLVHSNAADGMHRMHFTNMC